MTYDSLCTFKQKILVQLALGEYPKATPPLTILKFLGLFAVVLRRYHLFWMISMIYKFPLSILLYFPNIPVYLFSSFIFSSLVFYWGVNVTVLHREIRPWEMSSEKWVYFVVLRIQSDPSLKLYSFGCFCGLLNHFTEFSEMISL